MKKTEAKATPPTPITIEEFNEWACRYNRDKVGIEELVGKWCEEGNDFHTLPDNVRDAFNDVLRFENIIIPYLESRWDDCCDDD